MDTQQTDRSSLLEHPIRLVHLAPAPAPYRTRLLTRIAREIPQVELHSLFLCKHWRGHKWEQHLPDEINPIFFNHGDELAEEVGVRHTLLHLAKKKALLGHLREMDYQAAIVYSYRQPPARAAAAYFFHHGIPFFFLNDANSRNPPSRTILHKLVKSLQLTPVLQRSTGIMPMGELGEIYFNQNGGAGKPYFWVPNEPDYDAIRAIEPDAVAAFMNRFGLGENRKRILFSGRLLALKRIDLLIQAFASIALERPNWDIVIAGDGPLKESLISQVPIELRDRFHWLGYLQMHDMMTVYHASDVLVLPSDNDAWGLPINEAMAVGLPVVASDVCGAAWELVRGQGSGLLFATGHLSSLSHALRRITDPTEYPWFQKNVKPALRRWRTKADPIDGVKAALRYAGLLE